MRFDALPLATLLLGLGADQGLPTERNTPAREERLTKGSNAIAGSSVFPPSFLNFGQTSASRSHNFHAKPGPRDHF
jgi:hypothetical protein